MKISKRILATCLFISFLPIVSVGYASEVKKHFYFLGGGGEPEGSETIFDGDLKLVGSFTNSSSEWKTTVSFNGGHKKTEELIKSKMSKANNAGSFTAKSYDKLVAEMVAKIESGELKEGDQLMLSIDTHGARQLKEKTHQIAVSGAGLTDLNTLAGAETVSLDALEKLVDVAAKKNVKLAIIDMSCFSGNTLKIKNDNVCMISASGPNHYGYAGTVDMGLFRFTNTFSGKFYDLMKKGRNLEEIFLSARTRGDQPDFPMISTASGESVDNLLYNMMTPYLRYNYSTITDLDNSYSNNSEKFEAQVCSLNQNHEMLKAFLLQSESVARVTDQMGNSEFSKLRNALDEYREYQKAYEASIRGKFEVSEEIRNILLRDHKADQQIWERYEPMTFLTMNIDASIKRAEELANTSSGVWVRQFWKENAEQLKKHKQIAAVVKSKLDQVSKDKMAKSEKVFTESGSSRRLAEKVSTEAKKVYDSLYRSMKKDNEKNPCKDFVL